METCRFADQASALRRYLVKLPYAEAGRLPQSGAFRRSQKNFLLIDLPISICWPAARDWPFVKSPITAVRPAIGNLRGSSNNNSPDRD